MRQNDLCEIWNRFLFGDENILFVNRLFLAYQLFWWLSNKSKIFIEKQLYHNSRI